ncbi:MAG: TIGR04211 family SH3 domain-containing protein [Gammaproteobacteria bacterium]|nr:TIGR04211 family SH3 domain-containing protein [Gammaproteobacteria bacterium]
MVSTRGAQLALALAVLAAAAGAAAAEATRWISEQLEVDMRRGQSTQHAITRMVPSGTQVELLETNDRSGYSRIRTPSGAEGWVLTRFLQNRPPARTQLPETEARYQELRGQHGQLSDELRELRAERDGLQREVERLSAAERTLEQDLASVRQLSGNALALDEENRDLRSRTAAAEMRIDELSASNQSLVDNNRRSWFLAGAAVLLLGLLLGLLLPRIRWKRKSGWDRL